MRCKSVLTRIDALRTGELQQSDEGAVREHLRTCQSCDESLHDVGDLAQTMKSLAVEAPSCCDDVKDSFDQLDIDGTTVWVAFGERGLRMILHGGTETEFRAAYAKRYDRPLCARPLPDALRRQIDVALEGGNVDERKVDFSAMHDLDASILKVLTRIPRGEVRSYAWVARQAGRPKAVRAVGSVCARNAVPFVVPCHRVVPSTGGIGEYAFGRKLKRELLRREGVDVEALERLEKKHIRFIGSRTTKIVCFPTCKDARRIREDNQVPFHQEREALANGFRPCRRCQPFAA